jgi:hypothetical protein
MAPAAKMEAKADKKKARKAKKRSAKRVDAAK